MRSGSFSFTVLLSVIPFSLSVASIIGLLPISYVFTQHTERIIFSHFLPNTGDIFYQQFKYSMLQAKNLSWLGFLSLFLTAYIMFRSLEKHLNQMWHIRVHRKLRYSLLIYFFFLFLGPIIIAVLLLLQIYAKTYISLRLSVAAHELSYIMGVLLFIAIYKILPATNVKWKHAIFAGVIAGSCFELAKRVFIFYAKHFPVYSLLYGSLAVVPLFLIWVYISSLILFFCAQIIYILNQKNLLPYPNVLHKKK